MVSSKCCRSQISYITVRMRTLGESKQKTKTYISGIPSLLPLLFYHLLTDQLFPHHGRSFRFLYYDRNLLYCRASLENTFSDCNRLFQWRWATKCMTENVVNRIQSCHSRRSNLVDWKIQNAFKRVTTKNLDITSSLETSVPDAKETNT